MQELGLMERFADPALFVELSFADKLEGALVTTLMGMGTTFAVLIVMWGIIAFTSRIMKQVDRPVKKEASVTAIPTPAAPPKGSPAESSAMSNAGAEMANVSAELVAVLMGSIAAYEGTSSLNNLYIRKISRVSGSRPAWGNAGTVDSIDSRKW